LLSSSKLIHFYVWEVHTYIGALRAAKGAALWNQ